MSAGGPEPAEVVELEVNGRRLHLKNVGKVFWREAGFTKGDVIEYYRAVAPALLPHLAERPVTLARFPEGVHEPGWYQSQCRGAPAWLATEPVTTRTGEVLNYCVVNDVPSLVWLANQGTVELHPFLAPRTRPGRPGVVVLDLDPGPPAGVVESCRVALTLRDRLEPDGLRCFVKTSGSKGLHLYVPVSPRHDYEETKRFARNIARALAEERPGEVVDRQAKSLRRGKVLIDWSQNDAAKSTVAPYSLRATRLPSVSTPLRWEEVERAVERADASGLRFDPEAVLSRLDSAGDPFTAMAGLEPALPG